MDISVRSSGLSVVHMNTTIAKFVLYNHNNSGLLLKDLGTLIGCQIELTSGLIRLEVDVAEPGLVRRFPRSTFCLFCRKVLGCWTPSSRQGNSRAVSS